jgi:hypothetical protein
MTVHNQERFGGMAHIGQPAVILDDTEAVGRRNNYSGNIAGAEHLCKTLAVGRACVLGYYLQCNTCPESIRSSNLCHSFGHSS